MDINIHNYLKYLIILYKFICKNTLILFIIYYL